MPPCVLNGFLYRVLSLSYYSQSQADQLLPQLFMEQFDTLRYNVDTLNICMKEFGLLYPPQTLFVVG